MDGTLSNIPAFAEAFGCKKHTKVRIVSGPLRDCANGVVMVPDEPRQAVHALAVEHWTYTSVVVVVSGLYISILADPLPMCNCPKNYIVLVPRLCLIVLS